MLTWGTQLRKRGPSNRWGQTPDGRRREQEPEMRLWVGAAATMHCCSCMLSRCCTSPPSNWQMASDARWFNGLRARVVVFSFFFLMSQSAISRDIWNELARRTAESRSRKQRCLMGEVWWRRWTWAVIKAPWALSLRCDNGRHLASNGRSRNKSSYVRHLRKSGAKSNAATIPFWHSRRRTRGLNDMIKKTFSCDFATRASLPTDPISCSCAVNIKTSTTVWPSALVSVSVTLVSRCSLLSLFLHPGWRKAQQHRWTSEALSWFM